MVRGRTPPESGDTRPWHIAAHRPPSMSHAATVHDSITHPQADLVRERVRGGIVGHRNSMARNGIVCNSEGY